MMAKPALPLALLLFAFTPGLDPIGHAAEPEPWDVTKPRGRTRKIDFSTDEVWPQQWPYGDYPCVDSEIFRSDDRPIDYWDRSE
jgi:hypothetical protein